MRTRNARSTGTTVKRPVVSLGGSAQVDLFGAKLTASRQTAAGAH
jgi:hypothetical protein